MANYDQKLDYLTEQLVKYIEENQIDIDNDDHLDILRQYMVERFRINLTREPIRNRIKNLK